MNMRALNITLLLGSLLTGLIIFGCSKSVLLTDQTTSTPAPTTPSSNEAASPMLLKLDNRDQLELIFPSNTDKYNRAGQNLDPFARQDVVQLGARLELHPVEGLDNPQGPRVIQSGLELLHAKDGKVLLSRTFAPAQDNPFAKIFNQGTEDLLETLYLVSDGLTVKIQTMKRNASATKDEAQKNPWKGVLSTVAPNGTESRVGEIQGLEYVSGQ